MKNFLLSLLVFKIIVTGSYAQSISTERVERLKKSVARIEIESTQAGTGFFVASNGDIVTCWHVIEAAIIYDSLNRIRGVKKIYANLNDGRRIEMVIKSKYLGIFQLQAVSNDFAELSPKVNQGYSFTYLQLGKFSDIKEGEEIYTAGYPLGLKNCFISKGIFSTKTVDSIRIWGWKKDTVLIRNEALLDITLNKGNSGGPIIRFGERPELDRVIGIATYLINPFHEQATQIRKVLDSVPLEFLVDNNRVFYLSEVLKTLSEVAIYASHGISGCISIDHFSQVR